MLLAMHHQIVTSIITKIRKKQNWLL